jgi:hypothetical protein
MSRKLKKGLETENSLAFLHLHINQTENHGRVYLLSRILSTKNRESKFMASLQITKTRS